MTESQQETPRRRPPGLLEALVGLSILVSLSGIVMPIVGGEVTQSPEQQALMDMQHIVSGLRDYSQDTLYLPTGDEGRTNVSWLYGPGSMPSDNPFAAGGEARSIDDVLLNATMGGSKWQGPYLDAVPSDPWGRAYIVNVDGLVNGREQAMVLSAGPDGVVETSPTAARPSGDDILLPVN